MPVIASFWELKTLGSHIQGQPDQFSQTLSHIHLKVVMYWDLDSIPSTTKEKNQLNSISFSNLDLTLAFLSLGYP